MKTKCIMLLNGPDVARANEMGFPHIEEETRWASFWFDEEDIESAVVDYDEKMGDCISIIINNSSYMVRDTPELRNFLDSKFRGVDD